jgi:hypothetical protein
MELEAGKAFNVASKGFEGQPSLFGASPDISGSEPAHSDELWVEMIKKEYVAESQRRKRGGPLVDLRIREIAAADRKALWAGVRASYAQRKDTLIWAAVVFFLSLIILIPFTAESLDLLLALMISAIWTAVHTVRRV